MGSPFCRGREADGDVWSVEVVRRRLGWTIETAPVGRCRPWWPAGDGVRASRRELGPRAGTVSGMTVLATLDATGLEFVLRVEGYEFPQFDSGWDANWLVCDAELDLGLLGSFHAHHRPAVLTVEFERFRDQLRVLDEKLAGTAALEHTEEQVGLTVRMNAGKGTLDGFLADSTGRLSFENIEIDQSCVRRWLERSDEIVEAFPARGGLHD
jgi:hypothetical protein